MYEHAMYLRLRCQDSATVEEILRALKPLLDHCGYTSDIVQFQQRENVAADPADNDEFVITVDQAGKPSEILATTRGDADDAYEDVLRRVASSLAPLCEPDTIELHNHEASEEASAVLHIWVGPEDELLDQHSQSAGTHGASSHPASATPHPGRASKGRGAGGRRRVRVA